MPAASKIELDDNACHWPVAGEGTLFCGADRNGSWHPSYCRHHAARSVAVDVPGVLVRPNAHVRYSAHNGLNSDIAPCPRMGWTGRAPAQNRSENERGA